MLSIVFGLRSMTIYLIYYITNSVVQLSMLSLSSNNLYEWKQDAWKRVSFFQFSSYLKLIHVKNVKRCIWNNYKTRIKVKSSVFFCGDLYDTTRKAEIFDYWNGSYAILWLKNESAIHRKYWKYIESILMAMRCIDR